MKCNRRRRRRRHRLLPIPKTDNVQTQRQTQTRTWVGLTPHSRPSERVCGGGGGTSKRENDRFRGPRRLITRKRPDGIAG